MTVDLAARWLGGGVPAASDESFGFKEHLLVEDPAVFIPGRYDHRGEIVDGWETRRRRDGGPADCDWVIVGLGVPGAITSIDVDTSFFTGNYPTHCRVEALAAEGYPSVAELTDPGAPWIELAGWTPLAGDTHNVVAVTDRHRYSHLRLWARPDGGIARLRVFGETIPDPRLWDGVTVELSGAEHGGRVVWSSDEFYSSAHRLIRPDRPRSMGEGWETARRRDAGHDAVVIALAAAGTLCRFEVDTTHFKYNASAAVQLWGTTDELADEGSEPVADWTPLLPRTQLQPDLRHVFILDGGAVSAVRVDAFPDGGLARVRLLGTPTPAARAAAQRRWQDSIPAMTMGSSHV